MSDADRDYVENALNPADDPFQDEWIDESGCVHNVNAAAGGQNAPPQAISGMVPKFLIDHY